MSKISIEELCPFTIGDTLEFTTKKHGKQMFVITDIITVHSTKNQQVNFKYEFNNSGQYVSIDMFNEQTLNKYTNESEEKENEA